MYRGQFVQLVGCGTRTFSGGQGADDTAPDIGIRPSSALAAFPHPEETVRESIDRTKASPSIPNKGPIRGFVYGVETGRLREVCAA